MRKLTIALLVALLILPSLAQAEEVFAIFTHPTDGYKINMPSGFTVVTSHNIDAIADRIAGGEFSGEPAAAVSHMEKEIRQSGAALFISSTRAFNVSVSFEFAGETVPVQTLIDDYCPGIVEKYRPQFESFQVISPGHEFDHGNSCAVIGVAGLVNDVPRYVFHVLISANDKLYTVVYTVSATADFATLGSTVNAVIASFVPGE